jgi:1-acyl-sn-glycerol-3-phosphate acyltransferase
VGDLAAAEALLRLCVVLLTHTLYRVRVSASNVPETGGALLVPNHVSFLDGLFLLAAIDRPIRFVVEQYWYERPYLKPFLRRCGAIPIAASGGPRVVLRRCAKPARRSTRASWCACSPRVRSAAWAARCRSAAACSAS